MKTCSIKSLLALAGLGLLSLSTAASAAELRVRCEQRTVPSRAKISVDAKNLAQPNAMYSVRAMSGANQSTHVPLTAIGDEVEFDFDSNPADIAAGAQSIASNFIVGGAVQAALFDSTGLMVIGPVSAACRVRSPIKSR
jgi:hypothetical protein